MTLMKAKFLKALHNCTQSELVNIAFQLGEEFPERFEQLVTGEAGVWRTIRYADGGEADIQVPANLVASLEEYTRTQKVPAIKEVRDRTQLGLLECKLFVEQHVTKFANPATTGAHFAA